MRCQIVWPEVEAIENSYVPISKVRMVNPSCSTRLETRIEESNSIASGRVFGNPLSPVATLWPRKEEGRVMKVKGACYRGPKVGGCVTLDEASDRTINRSMPCIDFNRGRRARFGRFELEQYCWDPKGGELCVSSLKTEEILLEGHNAL